MKESIKHIPDATQLDVDFHSEKKEDGVTHLSQDDLDELATKDPVTHKAIMVEIEQQIESIEKQKELEDIDRRATEVEAAEALAKKREGELKASIVKALDDKKTDDDKETGFGNIYDTEEYAKRIREKNEKDTAENMKKKRKWW